MDKSEILKEIISLLGECDEQSATKCFETVSKIKEKLKNYGICTLKSCNKCAGSMPYSFCCWLECGEHEFCRYCKVRR